ncbi:DMT family transporter [Jannaschia aquimarina]|uniref:EamA-like transporter family protein n=1 Tax=Jannaschia aquimarina TaxID=935700 RepID=A0A0D1EG59_9RHOB|nr:DMT family transporter [Jannaschia aquimarina]KIT15886.1 EamA-like transporter family protein [Jannaschia aquimarina]SNS97030.1 EamA-like transporter family protein [Jannaschia aquimarina]
MTALPGAAPVPPPKTGGETRATLRGCALMCLSMACFAVEDALIKTLGGTIPPAQIVWLLGLGGTLVLALVLKATGKPLWVPELRSRRVVLRSAADAVGASLFVPAVVLIPLATASAVIQATPLVVAMSAALFLGATVGWRRWAAILVGFGGVLLILRPGADSFDPAVLLAVGGMVALAARDLATRGLPAELSGVLLSMLAFAAIVPAGLAVQLALGVPFVLPDAGEWAKLGGCLGFGLIGYLAIVGATRAGDLAVISSFRYSRMLFALILAAIFFGERPDLWTLVGIAVIVGAGLYTLIREARLARG